MQQSEFIACLRKYTRDVIMHEYPLVIAYLTRVEMPSKRIFAFHHIITEKDKVVLYMQLDDKYYRINGIDDIKNIIVSAYVDDTGLYDRKLLTSYIDNNGLVEVDDRFMEKPKGYFRR